ncbi:stage II sporulation protein M [Nocardioides sp.]|uniref:stage II sporulation protein M n=1 Tax=Nocardioides sp. TaxID=35761 RepID=UPI003D125ECE
MDANRYRLHEVATSLMLALALFSGVAALTAVLVDPSTLSGVDPGAQARSPGFLEILGRNLSAALLLYSGVVTVGLTAILGLIGVGAFVGGTLDVAVHNAGWSGVLGSTWPYILLEFGGMVLAAAAGLHPLVSTLLTARDGARTRTVNRYLAALTPSLKLLTVAAAMILSGAAVESLVISRR